MFSGYSYEMTTNPAKLCECSDIGGHYLVLSVKIELCIPLHSACPIRMQLIPIVYDVMGFSMYNFHNINVYVCNVNMTSYN